MTNLSDELATKRAWAKANILLEKQQIMHAATESLRSSGLAHRALGKGSRMPDFTLPNANSEPRSLGFLLESGPLIMSFYRGGWCPYCNLELRALQRELDNVRAAGGSLVAITPELPDKSASTSQKNELGFEVLSDRGNQLARQLGLVFSLPADLQDVYRTFDLNIPGHNGDDSWELPLAATYVVAQDRSIHYSFIDPDYTVRAEPHEVVQALLALRPSR